MALQEVMFHTGVANVPAHVARVASKVLRHNQTMWVLCLPSQLDAIDAALWEQGRADFLAHSRPGACEVVLTNSPITLVTALPELADGLCDRLLSTTQDWPTGCERFDKLIEVVSPEHTVQARQRWRRYAGMGVALSNTAIDKPDNTP